MHVDRDDHGVIVYTQTTPPTLQHDQNQLINKSIEVDCRGLEWDRIPELMLMNTYVRTAIHARMSNHHKIELEFKWLL